MCNLFYINYNSVKVLLPEILAGYSISLLRVLKSLKVKERYTTFLD